MRIILDECVPRPLKRHVAGHEVTYENGVLRSTMPSKSGLKALREAARATSKLTAGRLVEKHAQLTPRSRRTVRKRAPG